MKDKIYTSCVDLYGKQNFIPYTEMSDAFVSWIDTTCMELISKSTFSERKFIKTMKESNAIIVEQAYFRIKGKSYFLDFFLPEYMMAIEIDGKSHIGKFGKDYQRDKLFKSIGITTVRIANRSIYRKDFKEFISDIANKVLKNEYDICEYYLMPNANKYDGLMTMNQKLLDECIKILKGAAKDDKILVETDSTYLMFSICNAPRDNDNRENLNQIKEIHQYIKDKGITIGVKFSGKKDKMNKYQKRHIEILDANNGAIQFNKNIRLFCRDVKANRKLK